MSNDEELHRLFSSGELPSDILNELKSIQNVHPLEPQELFYKWESYSIKMSAASVPDLKTVRDFKKDLNDAFDREARGKASVRPDEKRRMGATPRGGSGTGDVFGMLDGLVPNTPRHGLANGTASTIKRKGGAFETPANKSNKGHPMSSPNTPYTNGDNSSTFAERSNAGEIIDQLNGHLPEPARAGASAEPRIKLKANTDLTKFSYKTMAMKLSEASEVLDDRIDEFMALVQIHHQLEDSAFGNAAIQSTSEIVAVGRIASEDRTGKLNASSLVLEMSRRTGAGFRIPLKVDSLSAFELFPGKIVALRGTNASGEFFNVSETLELPMLSSSASPPEELEAVIARLASSSRTTDGDIDMDSSLSETRPLNVIVGAGPYTTDTSLDFSPFHALLEQARSTAADSLILIGPFIDVEHPLIRSGDFDLPSDYKCDPDQATLDDLFKAHVSRPLQQLVQAVPSISIILVPSVRDAIAKHTAWPQARWDQSLKKALALPKQASLVTSPVTISLNEICIGISSLDTLEMIRANEVVGGAARQENIMARLYGQMIEQRSFLPVFPPPMPRALGALPSADEVEEPVEWVPMGAVLDTSYMKLGDMTLRPDILITPSILTPFVKVKHSVICINPGTLSKRKGAGTYARLSIMPLNIAESEVTDDGMVAHEVWKRARVDCVKI